MSLIVVPHHRPEDLAHWDRLAARDAFVHGRRLDRQIAKAQADLRAFFADDPRGYVGVSWGKDSTVVAHLTVTSGVAAPLMWIREARVYNPHSPLVRDAFLARFPHAYAEIETTPTVRTDGTTTNADGWAEANRRFGDRHVSGIRGAESRARKLRMKGHGVSTRRTCAPIGWWSADDVFGYLARFDLPVHPVYAMSRGGLYSRERLRVDCLADVAGTEFGRLEWELDYYPEEMAALRDRWDVAVIRAGRRICCD